MEKKNGEYCILMSEFSLQTPARSLGIKNIPSENEIKTEILYRPWIMQKKENYEVIVEIKKSDRDRVSNKMQSITGAGVCAVLCWLLLCISA